mgnify:CR=1 FL=1
MAEITINTNKNSSALPKGIAKKIGNTTYEITLFFSESSKETIEDKILKIIKKYEWQ